MPALRKQGMDTASPRLASKRSRPALAQALDIKSPGSPQALHIRSPGSPQALISQFLLLVATRLAEAHRRRVLVHHVVERHVELLFRIHCAFFALKNLTSRRDSPRARACSE